MGSEAFETVEGKDLRVGDVIEVWWGSHRDTIAGLRPYTGPLTCFRGGAQIATFALNQGGMTIENDSDFRRVVIPARSAA